MLPDSPAQNTEADDTPSAGCRDAGLKQAIRVAEEAGLDNYRVEIAPDGTIAIIVGTAAPDK